MCRRNEQTLGKKRRGLKKNLHLTQVLLVLSEQWAMRARGRTLNRLTQSPPLRSARIQRLSSRSPPRPQPTYLPPVYLEPSTQSPGTLDPQSHTWYPPISPHPHDCHCILQNLSTYRRVDVHRERTSKEKKRKKKHHYQSLCEDNAIFNTFVDDFSQNLGVLRRKEKKRAKSWKKLQANERNASHGTVWEIKGNPKWHTASATPSPPPVDGCPSVWFKQICTSWHCDNKQQGRYLLNVQ